MNNETSGNRPEANIEIVNHILRELTYFGEESCANGDESDIVLHERLKNALPEIFKILVENQLLDDDAIAAFTSKVIVRLAKGLPLTAIEGFDDEPGMWAFEKSEGVTSVYRSKRLRRMTAKIIGGKITYHDPERMLFESSWMPNAYYSGNYITDEIAAEFPFTASQDPFDIIRLGSNNGEVTMPYYPPDEPIIVTINYAEYLKCYALSIVASGRLIVDEEDLQQSDTLEVRGKSIAFCFYLKDVQKIFVALYAEGAGLLQMLQIGYDAECVDEPALNDILESIKEDIGYQWDARYGGKYYYINTYRDDRLYFDRIILPQTIELDLRNRKKALKCNSFAVTPGSLIENTIDPNGCPVFESMGKDVLDFIRDISEAYISTSDDCADAVTRYFNDVQRGIISLDEESDF